MKKFIFILSLLVARSSFAALEIGAGTTSLTEGRTTAALAMAFTGSDWAVSGFSTGVRTAYYYQSAYQLAYLRTWKAGDVFGGDLNAGFGGAVMTSIREFQDEGAASSETANDFLFGPAFRANLSYGRFYVDLTATYGVRDPIQHLQLTFQDVVCFSLGARLW